MIQASYTYSIYSLSIHRYRDNSKTAIELTIIGYSQAHAQFFTFLYFLYISLTLDTEDPEWSTT